MNQVIQPHTGGTRGIVALTANEKIVASSGSARDTDGVEVIDFDSQGA